jgi:predicted patatin/cPLA2 family phospholipase
MRLFNGFLLFLINSALAASDGKCYVLALEGGGDKGAYQAGALMGLVSNIPGNKYNWDVITGISVGALNAFGLSFFKQGDEVNAVNFILNIWKNIKGSSDIYDNWILGPLYGLMFETGLYNTSPLERLLAEFQLGRSVQRNIIIGATNIENGNLERFSTDDLQTDEYVQSVLTSSAFPIIFPNIQFRNATYMDGGVKVSLDITAGIHKCFDLGYEETNIIVDVVLCNSKILPVRDPANYHPMQVLMRYFEITGYDLAMRDVNDIIDVFDKVTFRYIVAPTAALPSGVFPLNFSSDEIGEMIDMGIQDAKEVVEMGTSHSFKKIITKYKKERREMLLNYSGHKRNV